MNIRKEKRLKIYFRFVKFLYLYSQTPSLWIFLHLPRGEPFLLCYGKKDCNAWYKTNIKTKTFKVNLETQKTSGKIKQNCLFYCFVAYLGKNFNFHEGLPNSLDHFILNSQLTHGSFYKGNRYVQIMFGYQTWKRSTGLARTRLLPYLS